MSDGSKFLAVVAVIFSMLVVRRVSPLGAFIMGTGLVILAGHISRGRDR